MSQRHLKAGNVRYDNSVGNRTHGVSCTPPKGVASGAPRELLYPAGPPPPSRFHQVAGVPQVATREAAQPKRMCAGAVTCQDAERRVEAALWERGARHGRRTPREASNSGQTPRERERHSCIVGVGMDASNREMISPVNRDDRVVSLGLHLASVSPLASA
eukprot:CAMPEP_0183356736 /NCGR_PEP_ID=MMETSP0164_2-20130417/45159_1 /TAXON_ID=221442 /ORGANISM="Coccolithus pelagicus ssp braarudi, Strain PLY182g" /LENGTH=159 /DNA_ID=CAMNT_0025530215 /DNA_START=73 /DNA_END=550 /DNA_ORIENTATION=-